MAIKVFPMRLYYPLQHEIMFSNVVASMGDGYEQRANKNIAFVQYDKDTATFGRADGLGNTATSYRGINRFTITMKNLTYQNQTIRSQDLNADNTKLSNRLWRYYQDTYGSFESFYFYNPAEQSGDPATDTGLTTGTTTVGRYLVRF